MAENQQFIEAVRACLPIARSNAISTFAGVYITAGAGGDSVVASSGNGYDFVSVSVPSEAEWSSEPQFLTKDQATLYCSAASLPGETRFDQAKRGIAWRHASGRGSVKCISRSQAPAVDKIGEAPPVGPPLALTSGHVLQGLLRAAMTAGDKKGAVVYAPVTVEARPSSLVVYGTDSRRIMLASTPAVTSSGVFALSMESAGFLASFLIPGDVALFFRDGWLNVEQGGRRMLCQASTMKIAPVAPLIERHVAAHEFTVGQEAIDAAVNRFRKTADESAMAGDALYMQYLAGECRLHVFNSNEDLIAEETLDASGEVNMPTPVKLSGSFLASAVGCMRGPIRIGLNSLNSLLVDSVGTSALVALMKDQPKAKKEAA